MNSHWFMVIILLGTSVSSQLPAQDLGVIGLDAGSRTKTETASTSNFRVLSIGITKYYELPSLEFTASDARRLIQSYSEVGGVEESRLSALVDDEGKISLLSGELITERVRQFLRECSSKDIAVLFFSGHGVRVASGFALAASDFSVQNGLKGAISIEQLRSELAGCAARSKIVILDCCHSGAFSTAPSDMTEPFRSIPRCVVMAASRPSEASLETHTLKSGVFTHWLVLGMRGAANSKIDGVVDATELFEFVSKSVKQTTSNLQSPAIAFDQTTEIPRIIELRNPDRPSDTVGVIPFPLPPTPETMSIVLDTIGRFPDANPRRTIGVCNWVLKHSKGDSESSKQARKLIAEVDSLILSGKAALGSKQSDEETLRD